MSINWFLLYLIFIISYNEIISYIYQLYKTDFHYKLYLH